WGEGLLALVYGFMEREESICGPPTFSIPQMCFVEAAMVIIQGHEPRVLLGEELISVVDDGGFRKYLDNAHAIPFDDLNVKDRFHAEFLCFTQHVQWVKTGAKAFIADY
ncbi:hypothetical protein K439DRAFT_1371784, partial [Ramaria rubella]